MLRALYSASTGMRAQQLNLDTISNNLANVNTIGFLRSRTDFQELLYATLRSPGQATRNGGVIPTGIQVGHGVRAIATPVDFSQGSLKETGSALDLAIEGNGFFSVRLPDDTIAYTRDGSFKLDREGYLVTANGYYVLDANRSQIFISDEAVRSIVISPDGIISVQNQNDNEFVEAAQLGLSRFPNPTGMEKIGRNLFKPTEAAGLEAIDFPLENGLGGINQGFLEMSNVQVVVEMVDMIQAQRAYELNSKAISTSDEMLQVANNLKR